MNPDGTLALLGLNDGTAGIFSTATGERLSTFYPPGTNPAERWCVLRAVGFSGDGSLAIVGFADRSAGIWRTDGFQLVRFLTSSCSRRLFREPAVRPTFVSSVAISRDKRHAFAGCADMAAQQWDIESGHVCFEAFEHVEEVVGLWADEHCLRWATSGGSLWEGSAGAPTRRLLATGESWSRATFVDRDTATVLLFTGKNKNWRLDGKSEVLWGTRLYWDSNEANPFFRKEIPLSGGRSIEIEKTTLTVREKSEEKLRFPIPYAFRSQWFVSQDESFVVGVFPGHILICWSLRTGQQLHSFERPVRLPESLPGPALWRNQASGFTPAAGCCLWRLENGRFLHLGDGPRGWVTPLQLSNDERFLIIPGRTNAALLDISDGQEIVELFEFSGRLRASLVLSDRILMVNSAGKVYQCIRHNPR